MDDISIDKTLGGGKAEGEQWTLREGEILGGYRVIRPLGRGGMGEVYLVENIEMGMPYALKRLPAGLASDPEFRERFRREARVMAELDHPGIVRVHHMAAEGSRFFLAMDYVEGPEGGPRTLDAVLKERGRLPEDEAGRITLELCDALRYAHGRGVVHRDIKPANVLLDRDGRAKLADFGLARIVGDEFVKGLTQRSISLSMARTDRGAALSQSDNAVIGTYEYMSPEQQAGKPADERSDIYSLGLVIYRMLTGERAVGAFEMPSEAGCSDSWDPVVRKALATKPDRRYASVGELAGDVGQAAEKAQTERRRAAEERARREREEAEHRRLEEEEHRRMSEERERRRREEAARRRREEEGRRREEHETEQRRREGAACAVPVPRRSRKGVVAVAARPKAPSTAFIFLVTGTIIIGVGAIAVAAILVLGKRLRLAPAGVSGPTTPQAQRQAAPPVTSRRLAPTLSLDLGGGVAMDLVLIPAGEFTMGSPNSEAERGKNEGSQHRVRITKPFYMGKYEVTQAQYERIMGTNPSHFRGAGNPVDMVLWNDAMEFCRKLLQWTGRKVRLPTEAEWEYACRAGTTTPFHFGSSLSLDQANFDGDFPYGGVAKGVDRGKTTPVGSFPANAWGLHDMHGNVWEWCSDWYDKGYYAKSPREDPTGPAKGRVRVVRGGSWGSSGGSCRSASRYQIHSVSFATGAGGFRVAVVAPGQ